MLKTFHASDYRGNSRYYLPLHCRACNTEIREGDKFEHMRPGRRSTYLCQTCYQKPVIVYSVSRDNEIKICLNSKPCKWTGDRISSHYCLCITTRQCDYRFRTTKDYIATTRLTSFQLMKLKYKYMKQGIRL